MSTIYSTQDLYDILEVIQVDAHNRRLHQEWYDANRN
jgi:hypothetical protein